MRPKDLLLKDGVLNEARDLIQVHGYTMAEAAHAIRKKYNPLENQKKKTMCVTLGKLLNGEDLVMNEEARSKNIYLVGKQAQRVLNSYNKWKGTNYSLVDFKSYTKTSSKQYSVILKDGKEINITGREIRKIRNTRLVTFLNFGTQNIKDVVCPVSGLPLVYKLEAFSNRPKVEETYTFDLHHMDVSKDGKSEIKNGAQPSKIMLEVDLFDQDNIETLTEFFGMIMLSPSGHKGIHSEYSAEAHKIDDYMISKRPFAIRSEKNYLRFHSEFGLTPLYSYAELADLLGFTIPKNKKRYGKLTEDQRRRKDRVKVLFSNANNKDNFNRPADHVYEEIMFQMRVEGLQDQKHMKLVSFKKARSARAKEQGWI